MFYNIAVAVVAAAVVVVVSRLSGFGCVRFVTARNKTAALPAPCPCPLPLWCVCGALSMTSSSFVVWYNFNEWQIIAACVRNLLPLPAWLPGWLAVVIKVADWI